VSSHAFGQARHGHFAGGAFTRPLTRVAPLEPKCGARFTHCLFQAAARR
jgi:hypothetical protein